MSTIDRYPQGGSVRRTYIANPVGRGNTNPNLKANAAAVRAMTPCQRMTGRTAEELDAEQRRLRDEFYARRAA